MPYHLIGDAHEWINELPIVMTPVRACDQSSWLRTNAGETSWSHRQALERAFSMAVVQTNPWAFVFLRHWDNTLGRNTERLRRCTGLNISSGREGGGICYSCSIFLNISSCVEGGRVFKLVFNLSSGGEVVGICWHQFLFSFSIFPAVVKGGGIC